MSRLPRATKQRRDPQSRSRPLRSSSDEAAEAPVSEIGCFAWCAELASAIRSVQYRPGPRTPEEARDWVLQGLARVADACTYIDNIAATCRTDFSPDVAAMFEAETHPNEMAFVGQLARYLHSAVLTKNVERIRALTHTVSALDNKANMSPFGILPRRPQAAARVLASDVECLRAGGVNGALRARAEAAGQALDTLQKIYPEQHPATRIQVARWLAIYLRSATNIATDEFRHAGAEECTAIVYDRLPHGGHGRSVDRNRSFMGETFTEDPEKTVIASFKAAGFPTGVADQLFHARAMHRSRKTKEKQRASRVSGNKRRM